MMESFTIHARALFAFLYLPRKLRDDAIAADFWDDGASWERERGPIPEALVPVAGRVGKEIAHLTYTRLVVTAEEKAWHVGHVTRELLNVLTRFATGASRGKLGDVCRAFILSLPRLR